jgi:hypothetical protein
MLTRKQSLKILKTAVYLALSAALGYLISLLEKNPASFGVYTPFINLLLVTLRQVFKVEEPEEAK